MIKETKLGLGDYIEKYRLIIGLVLLVLVCGGISYLIYRENYWKPSIEEQISAQESRIAELEIKLSGAKSEPAAVDPATIVQAITQPAADAAPKSAETSTAPAPTVAVPATTTQSKIVNINTATLADFDSLPGIGPVLSKRIVDYREKNGPFASIEGLKKVSGIGDKTYLKFKDLLAL